jgi:branched-chain amino acid aminotransferase
MQMPQLADPKEWLLPTELSANGCFETMRAYNGRIFRLEAHLDRLYGSVKTLGTPFARQRAWLRAQLLAALRKSGLKEAVVRVALVPEPGRPTQPVIVVRPVQPLPPSAYARGIRVAVVPARSFPVACVDPQAKYSARLGSVLAVLDAQARGADEALFMDSRGYVTESTASNFAIIKRGTLITPPCSQGLLWGITRQVLCELAQYLSMPTRDGQLLTRHEIYTADEVVFTSTLKEVLPVSYVDGRRIASGRPGPFAPKLQGAFRQMVREELQLE